SRALAPARQLCRFLHAPDCLARISTLLSSSPAGACELLALTGAHNSAVECDLHTVEVTGSNPVAPTQSWERCAGGARWAPLRIRLVSFPGRGPPQAHAGL